jgi:hypothetical protein
VVDAASVAAPTASFMDLSLLATSRDTAADRSIASIVQSGNALTEF